MSLMGSKGIMHSPRPNVPRGFRIPQFHHQKHLCLVKMDDFDIDTLPYIYNMPQIQPLRGRPSSDWDPLLRGPRAYADLVDGFDPVCAWTNYSFPLPSHSSHDRCSRLERRRMRRYSDGWREGEGYERRGRYSFMYGLERERGIPLYHEQRRSYRNLPYHHRRRSMRFPRGDCPHRACGGVFRRTPQPARNAGEAVEVKEEKVEYEVEELQTEIDDSGPSNVAGGKKKASETSPKVRYILPPPGARPHSPTSTRQNASPHSSREGSPKQHESSDERPSSRLSFPSSFSDSSSDLPSAHAHHRPSQVHIIHKARKAISKKWEKLNEAEKKLTEEEHRLDEWEMRILTEEVDAYGVMPNEGAVEEGEDSGDGWWSVLSEMESGESGDSVMF